MIRKPPATIPSPRARHPHGRPATPNLHAVPMNPPVAHQAPPLIRPAPSRPRIHPARNAVRPPGEAVRRGSGERKRPLPPATSWPRHGPRWPRPLPSRPRMRRRLRRSRIGVVEVAARRPWRIRTVQSTRLPMRGAAPGHVALTGTRMRGSRMAMPMRTRFRGSRTAISMRTRVRGRMTAAGRIRPVDAGVAVAVGAGSTGNVPGALVPTPRMTAVDLDGAAVGVGGMGPVRNRPVRLLRRVAAPSRRLRTSACVC